MPFASYQNNLLNYSNVKWTNNINSDLKSLGKFIYAFKQLLNFLSINIQLMAAVCMLLMPKRRFGQIYPIILMKNVCNHTTYMWLHVTDSL